MKQRTRRLMALMLTASMAASGAAVPVAAADDPYKQAEAAADDPYKQADAAADDPYKQAGAAADDPYKQADAAADDPYKQAGAAADDPYKQAGAAADDPYKQAAAATDDPYKQAANADDPYKQAEEASDATDAIGGIVPSADAKYTISVTEDGWIKVENEDGDTLGLAADSAVKLLEADGYAFKDMNQNGELDKYEDWRLSTEERAADLVNQMQGEEMAAVLTHGGWGDFTTEPLAEDDGSYTYLMQGGRGGVTRNIKQGGTAHAKWANAIQAVAEQSFYGIPAMISIDPANISGLVETLSLASTMDTELAAEIGQETAKEYRAAGVNALLGPQVDIASPIMSRSGGTYGEDPQLTLDIATAYINGMQSTYDENGEDLGWGDESVYCFTKHFSGDGSTEGGRDDHANGGRYAVFPGNNLEAHLITFFDGAFNLPGKTGTTGIMTQYGIDVDADGNPYGGEWAGAYNTYLNGMLDEAGFEGLKITDWGVYQFAGVWGAEDLEEADRIATSWENGVNLLGGYSDVDTAKAAYGVLVDRDGQDKADEIMRAATEKFVAVMMNLNTFENPYVDTAYADTIITTDGSSDFAKEGQRESIVMLKNDGTISADGAASEKPTVYVPYVYNTGWSATWMSGISEGTPTWTPGMDIDKLSQYFNVVTDTLGDPTGEADAEGNATADEIAACDYVLVGMTNAYATSYESHLSGAFGGEPVSDDVEEVWYPASLQYGEYTADTAREVSIGGKTLEDGTKENRSYKGVTAHEVPNYGDLEALQYANENAGDVPVIVSMKMERGMVWDEVEPLADVILVNYNQQREDIVAEVILGQTEPTGLLVFQQPVNMEAVEAQLEDVPRDMECYTDAAGNTYDFAFGLNWSGKIDDDRTAKYTAEPLTKVQNFDYSAYEAANK